jgi:hypothetical protein
LSDEGLSAAAGYRSKVERSNTERGGVADVCGVDIGKTVFLTYVDLPPLKKTSYLFTFHKESIFGFKCMQHKPAMGGQFLVLPPVAAG